MKNIVILLSIIIYLLNNYGCDSNPSSSRYGITFLQLTGNLQPSHSIVGGKITMRDSKNNQKYVFAESAIDSEGYFKLIVPPPPEYLFNSKIYDYTSTYGTNERHYSDTTGKYFQYSYFQVQSKDTVITYASCWGDSLGNGNYNNFIEFIYSSKNVSLTGKDSMFSTNLSIVINIRLSLSIGWNKVVHTYLREENKTKYYEYNNIDNSINGYWIHQRFY